jgi:16S rRNA (guanine527-N7)-methyltransferase
VTPKDRVARRLSELGRNYGLDPPQLAALDGLLDALESDEHAPTSVRAREQAVDVHIADSLAALTFAEVQAARAVADIGAGSGFPGLALAIALRDADVALLESNGRKCAFMCAAVARARVSRARPICVRAEEWTDGIGTRDLVLARAVAPQAVVLEYGAPLLRLGGSLLDWRGARSPEEEEAALIAAHELGLVRMRVELVQPFAAAREHHLHLFTKTGTTPERYPRRAGIARKRPLGGRT